MKVSTLAKILLAPLILIALLVALLPTTVKWLAGSWLQDQGLEASIDHVDISLLDSRFGISGAKGVNAEGQGFSIGHFAIDFSWSPLRDNQVHINDIILDQFTLDTQQDADGLQSVAGIDLRQFGGSSEAEG